MNAGQLVTFNTVSKRYQGTGILKSDCKQPLRIGIIRALNECTGRNRDATYLLVTVSSASVGSARTLILYLLMSNLPSNELSLSLLM